MFRTHVANVCLKCFICFKCMLHSSVSCCKCKLPALVSMRAGRAKSRPPTHGGGAVVEEAGASLPGGLEEMGAALVLEEAGASHPSSVGSGSEAGGLDASAENGAGVDSARILADRVEQSRVSRWTQASGRSGASAAIVHCRNCSTPYFLSIMSHMS
jgi:hypothetical protein